MTATTVEYDTPAAEAADRALAPDTESPYSVSFKTQRGTLVSVRGRTAEELAERLALASAPIGAEGDDVLSMISAIDAMLSGGAVPQQGGGQPQQELTPPCETCGGRTEARSGTSKSTGKPYSGYFCTVNRDHKPKFNR